MLNDSDVFNNIPNNAKAEHIRKPFKLTQLKLEIFHLNDGELDLGMPISTSIELNSNYNYEAQILEWEKTISHTYISSNGVSELKTSEYKEKDNNISSIIEKIEKLDLRNLGNNYYTEDAPNDFSHWEITYNNYFKIVGTMDQYVKEYNIINDLLDMNKTIRTEISKVKKQMEKMEG